MKNLTYIGRVECLNSRIISEVDGQFSDGMNMKYKARTQL